MPLSFLLRLQELERLYFLYHSKLQFGFSQFKTNQEVEEAVEADEVQEPPFSKGTLHVGQPYVISITVKQAQGIPTQYTDVFCQIR